MIRNKALGGFVALALAGLMLGGCQDKLKSENEALWRENQELHDELRSSRSALEAANLERSTLQQQLAERERQREAAARQGDFEGLAGDGVEVERGIGQVTVRVAGDVLFDSGKADLKPAAQAKLRQVAGVLNQNPNQRIRIEGHTDSDPIRRTRNIWRDNHHLSDARAAAVRDYLAQQGVSRGRMSIQGFGPDNPRAANTSAAGKAQNRRVEIVVTQ